MSHKMPAVRSLYAATQQQTTHPTTEELADHGH